MNAEYFQVRASSAGREPTNFQEKTFLVIDDAASMRSSLRTTISTLGGTRIDMTGNGIQTINRLEQHAYDVILCNYDLGGGKDGLGQYFSSTCARLHTNKEKILGASNSAAVKGERSRATAANRKGRLLLDVDRAPVMFITKKSTLLPRPIFLRL